MRVLNKRYWPAQVQTKDKSVEQMERWCYDNFASKNWRNVGQTFAFKNEGDAVLFSLKWA